PPTTTYQQLFAIARRNPDAMRPIRFNFTENRRISQLDNFAANNNVRVLVGNTTSRMVSYDSAGVYPDAGQPQNFQLDRDFNPQLALDRLPREADITAGAFTDLESVEWLFVGIVSDNSGEGVFLAEMRPTGSLQDALAQFSSALGLPLLQAAVVGLIVAVVLAALISGNIARPLQTVARATQSVAQGDFEQKVPLAGPPEVRAVAEAFNQMTAEVHRTHQSQRDFLANVSHDLKTPLTSIQGYSQAIMDGATKDPARAAAIICDEAGRLTRMVTELTDLARLQAGAVEMRLTLIDAGQIVNAIAHRVAVVAEQKNITLSTDIQTVPPIAGDGDRLAQVFTNLISNAVNYTPEHGKIWVKVQPGRGGVEISVRDTGIGIAPDELERIFERFYQVDKTRGPRRGTGLGLAITREIVQAHGGSVSVSSPGEGGGSTFMVWLPLGRSAENAPDLIGQHREA
ncbi:MAG: HAMP domain-containing histidine kinase, partial [Armatimonadetes bacterium]|nr:HAMP domain-containing histidine kinase [Anaerolineae bacterium]